MELEADDTVPAGGSVASEVSRVWAIAIWEAKSKITFKLTKGHSAIQGTKVVSEHMARSWIDNHGLPAPPPRIPCRPVET